MSQQETATVSVVPSATAPPKRGRPRKYVYPEGVPNDPVERKKIANREYHIAHSNSKASQLRETQDEVERLKERLAEESKLRQELEELRSVVAVLRQKVGIA